MTEKASKTFSDAWGGPTQWTLIHKAADPATGADRDQAWTQLIERYRRAVERSMRRQVSGHADSQEITDEFFGYLYEKAVLPKIDPDQGRFRCFIQGVIRNYAKHALRSRTPKRQERRETEDLPQLSSMQEYESEELHDWSDEMLHHALSSLCAERERDGLMLKKIYGVGGEKAVPRKDLREEFGLSETALNVAIHRARGRLRDLILEEVRQTVASAQDLEDEAVLVHEYLFAAYPGLMAEE